MSLSEVKLQGCQILVARYSADCEKYAAPVSEGTGSSKVLGSELERGADWDLTDLMAVLDLSSPASVCGEYGRL